MRTRTAPWDYKQPQSFQPQLVHLCMKCGDNVYIRPSDNKLTCVSCGSNETDRVHEFNVGTFRRGLMEIEHYKALVFVGFTVLAVQ